MENDLFGFAQNKADGSLVIAVAGTEMAVNQFKKICEQGPKKANVTDVVETQWSDPVKVGFEIKRNPRKKRQAPKKQNHNNKTAIQKIKHKVKNILSIQ